MLPKKRRISRTEFPQILARGRRHNSLHLLLYITPIDKANSPNESKFSFSVSKKVSKLAVDRNKHRRRGYSIIQRYINTILPGFLYFFSFKKGSNKVSFSALEMEIRELLSEAHMLS